MCHRETKGSKAPKSKRKPKFGILHQSSDWVMCADIGKQLKFPSHIAPDIGKRPDIVIFSNVLKVLILIELTCPCEERFMEEHKKKFTRYGPGSDIYIACSQGAGKYMFFLLRWGHGDMQQNLSKPA